MITLNYDFDDNETFEYEVDPKEYFDELDDADTLELGKEIYDSLSNDEKTELMNSFGSDVVSFNSLNDISIDLARGLINDSNTDELAKDYIEQITDYFYDEAKDVYEDTLAYNADKYGYYGVSERDFY